MLARGAGAATGEPMRSCNASGVPGSAGGAERALLRCCAASPMLSPRQPGRPLRMNAACCADVSLGIATIQGE